MFGRKTDKEKNRFYLFPGQGGVAFRRKKRIILVWSAVVAVMLSAVLGALLYWLDRVNPR